MVKNVTCYGGADGTATVSATGDNSAGQTNVPAGLTGVVAVAAGSGSSMALKSDGTVVERAAGAARMFDLVRQGIIKADIRQRYPLTQAAQAHRDLDARKTSGSTILLP